MADADSGSATVELALMLPLIVLLLVAMAEIAVIGRSQLELVNSAREGARVAAVNPEPADAVEAAQDVLGAAGVHARVAVTRPQVVGEAAIVHVTIHHRLVPYLFGGATIDLTATASMRVER